MAAKKETLVLVDAEKFATAVVDLILSIRPDGEGGLFADLTAGMFKKIGERLLAETAPKGRARMGRTKP